MSGISVARGATVVELPTISDGRGDLSFFQTGSHVPFAIGAVRWTAGPGAVLESGRLGDAHEEFLVAVHGRVDVTVRSAHGEHTIALGRPSLGLHLSRGVWRELIAVTQTAVCLVCSAAPPTAAPPAGA